MKTNQIMSREQGFLQRTKDYYFNANELLKYYNSKGKTYKLLQNYRSQKSAKEFEQYLINEGIEKPVITTTGKSSGTWMHPKIFIDFAMWVSLEFKSKVIDMVMDGLIESRLNAGDYYKEMSSAIMDKYVDCYHKKPSPMIFINEARMIKSIAGIGKGRNELTEKELQVITILQKVNSTLITESVGKESRKRQLNLISRSLNL